MPDNFLPPEKSKIRTTSDKDLAKSCKGPEFSEIKRLYLNELARRHYMTVLKAVRQRRVRRPDAENVASDAWEKILRALLRGQYDQNLGEFAAWISTIARNCANDYWRKEGANPEDITDDPYLEETESRPPLFPSSGELPPDEAVEVLEARSAILRSLGELQPRIAEAIALNYFHFHENKEEAANAMKVSPSTFDTYLKLGKAHLAKDKKLTELWDLYFKKQKPELPYDVIDRCLKQAGDIEKQNLAFSTALLNDINMYLMPSLAEATTLYYFHCDRDEEETSARMKVHIPTLQKYLQQARAILRGNRELVERWHRDFPKSGITPQKDI
jgi:RNA polymerase sigma factor (sigma-70 family)